MKLLLIRPRFDPVIFTRWTLAGNVMSNTSNKVGVVLPSPATLATELFSRCRDSSTRTLAVPKLSSVSGSGTWIESLIFDTDTDVTSLKSLRLRKLLDLSALAY